MAFNSSIISLIGWYRSAFSTVAVCKKSPPSMSSIGYRVTCLHVVLWLSECMHVQKVLWWLEHARSQLHISKDRNVAAAAAIKLKTLPIIENSFTWKITARQFLQREDIFPRFNSRCEKFYTAQKAQKERNGALVASKVQGKTRNQLSHFNRHCGNNRR